MCVLLDLRPIKYVGECMPFTHTPYYTNSPPYYSIHIKMLNWANERANEQFLVCARGWHRWYCHASPYIPDFFRSGLSFCYVYRFHFYSQLKLKYLNSKEAVISARICELRGILAKAYSKMELGTVGMRVYELLQNYIGQWSIYI